jgi:hypothetical protein
MTTKRRIAQLEKTMPKAGIADGATLRPSEILARVDKLIQAGGTVSEDQRKRLDTLRLMVVSERTANHDNEQN